MILTKSCGFCEKQLLRETARSWAEYANIGPIVICRIHMALVTQDIFLPSDIISIAGSEPAANASNMCKKVESLWI